MTEVLRVHKLHAGYNGNEVIHGLSFSVNSGDVVVVAGPNGSGKTTLLHAVLGMLRPISGIVRLFGKERLIREEAESRVAYIPQRLEVDRTFPINLREFLGLSVRRATVDTYLDLLDLRGLLDKRVGELSGGQMQRALLAYAITKEPDLLVMDEPTSWVDAKGADCILCIMEEFKHRGIAMLVVSHDISSMGEVATHILGLGPEGYFFEPADTEGLEEQVVALFGTTHHHGKGALICPLIHHHEHPHGGHESA
jgi:zinc transport system ATP-binding protein